MRELRFRAWVYYGENLEKPHYSRDYYSLDRFFEDHDENDIDQCIEQYTGLKDKNSKEIYEGDILKFRGRAYEVKFDNYGQFYMENKNYHWLENGYSFRSVDIWCAEGILVEIIGNIHENQELLEHKG